MTRKFDRTILDLIEGSARNFKALPLNLGAVAGSGGGIGSPPGGYIGWLPQTRIAYDFEELATLDTSISGSLLDNLNHIRYRLGQVEASSGVLVVDDWDGSPSINPTDRITFSGGVIVTDLGGGHALVTITASGGGSALTVEEADGSPSVANVDKIIFSGFNVTSLGSGDVLVSLSGSCVVIDDLTPQITTSGVHFNLQTQATCRSGVLLFYNGVYQSYSYFTVDSNGLGITTSFPTYSGDTLVAAYNFGGGGGTTVTSGGSGTDSNAIHSNVANEISAITEKTTLSSNDIIVIEDSDASYVKKKVKKSTVISSIWDLALNESGSSFANWTGISGTWSSASSVIKQTDTSAGTKKSRFTNPIANAGFVMQAEIQFKTNAADAHVGFLIHYNGTGTNSIFVYPRLQEDDVRVEQEGTAEASLYTGYTINIDTWYTLKVVTFGNVIDTYLDGILVGSTVVTQVNSAGRYIGLATTNTEGWFRNIKAWTLALPV